MKVFIVEDSELVRASLEAMLSDIPQIEIVGHAVSEQEAIEKIDSVQPDVVILDIRLAPGSGINVLKNVKARHAAIKAMMLSNYADEIYVNHCLNAGADYFFDKTFQLARVGAVLSKWALAG